MMLEFLKIIIPWHQWVKVTYEACYFFGQAYDVNFRDRQLMQLCLVKSRNT